MLVVGITGSIGSGKTTLSSMLEEKGAEIFDADVIAHEVIKAGSTTWQDIINTFGEGVLEKNREIDRKKLAKVVFSQPENLEMLNRIVHPVVIKRINKKLEETEKERPESIVVIDAPLIIEAGMVGMLDLLVVVVAREDVRLSRAASMGLTPEDVRVRDGSQIPQKEKIELAGYIIENEGSLAELRKKAEDLWETLQKKLGKKRV